MNILKVFQEYFSDCLQCVSRLFNGCLGQCFIYVSRMFFDGALKFSRLFAGCFKNILSEF